MADDNNLHLPADQSLDYHIITLFQRLETMRREQQTGGCSVNVSLQNAKFLPSYLHKPKHNMQAEIRTLEFWRSIIAECLASFLYVFIVCGAAAGAGVGASVSSVLLASALASGFAITTLTQCFSNVSGAHINPSVTFGMAVIGAVSPLRAAMYITAQCGGAIAGAGLLYGVTVPGYQGNLQAAISHSSTLAPWERFGVELILTFVVVLAYFMSTHSYKSYFGSSAIAIGAAYSACSFVSMPYLNPARSLGPSFVLNKWENHWIFWVGPLAGAFLSALVYLYVFNPRGHLKRNKNNNHLDTDSGSMQSDDDINYDMDMEKSGGGPGDQHGNKYHHRAPNTPAMGRADNDGTGGRRGGQQQQEISAGYCQSLYSTANKFDHSEPLYGGTRSLYCKSPPLTRANLNRSQSVYAKSQTAINRDLGTSERGTGPRSGPLVPAQSLYPMRLSTNNAQSSHLQNQNVQNQMQQRSESIYGIRGSIKQKHSDRPMDGAPVFYGTGRGGGGGGAASIGEGLCKYDRQDSRGDESATMKYINNSRSHRPDSMYGVTTGAPPASTSTVTNNGQRRGQSTQSDDSSYGSYHGPSPSITPPTRLNCTGDPMKMPTMQHNATVPVGVVVYNSQQQQQKSSDRKTSTGSDRLGYTSSSKNQSNSQGGGGGVQNGDRGGPLTHQQQYNMPMIR